jgi:hypothetical protein
MDRPGLRAGRSAYPTIRRRCGKHRATPLISVLVELRERARRQVISNRF